MSARVKEVEENQRRVNRGGTADERGLRGTFSLSRGDELKKGYWEWW